mgnify:CR=1 FL=1
MNEDLYRDLIADGVAPDVARRLASKHTVSQGTVNTDVLFKTLEDIRGLQPADTVTADLDTTPPLTDQALIKAMSEFDSQFDQMQAASDAIVDHVLSSTDDRKAAQLVILERQDVLAKGIVDVTDALKKSMDQQNTLFMLMEKLTGQPARQPKAVTGDRVPVTAPGDNGDPLKKGNADVGITAQQVLAKALGELDDLAKGEHTMKTGNRMSQLHNAVSAIEAHQSPSLVAQKFDIKVA